MTEDQKSNPAIVGETSPLPMREKVPGQGPRVSRALVDQSIAATFYMTGDKMLPDVHEVTPAMTLAAAEMKTLVICVLVLTCGLKVVGYSQCIAAENFNIEQERQKAYRHAFEQVWAMQDFLLKQMIAWNAVE